MTPDQVQLRDRSVVTIRPIEPSDREGIRTGFERLSPESRYRRFLSATPRLNERQLDYLVNIDHHEHEALAAIDDQGDIVGVARYVRDAGEDDAAEVAVTVADHIQRQGLGRALLERLARRAREEGFERFTAVVLAANEPIVDVLGDVGDVARARPQDGLLHLVIELPEEREVPGAALVELLRRAADGSISTLKGRFMTLSERVRDMAGER